MTQAVADEVCQMAYEHDPLLMIALADQERFSVVSYHIDSQFEALIKRIKKEEGFETTYGFTDELIHRLAVMCEVLPYGQRSADSINRRTNERE